MTASRPIVGVVPAAGRARRISPMPCSKEIFPIGFRTDEHGQIRTQVVSHQLLAKFARAGATRAYIVLRDGKWDIPAYFGDGHLVGLDLAYVVIPGSIGPPDTVDRAYHFVTGCDVVFGFPDILFGPDDVFEILLMKMRESKADLALGLYPAVNPQQMDMTQVDDRGRVGAMFLKPKETELRYGWLCAAWSPTFTEFLHGFVRGEVNRQRDESAYAGIDPQGDLPMGAPLKAAIESGIETCAVAFPEARYVDIGVPENLVDAVRGRSGF